MQATGSMKNIWSSSVVWMQSTGHTSTQVASFTSMQGSVMMKGMLSHRRATGYSLPLNQGLERPLKALTPIPILIFAMVFCQVIVCDILYQTWRYGLGVRLHGTSRIS